MLNQDTFTFTALELLNKAERLMESGKADSAIICYQKAIEISPTLSDAFFGLGNIHLDAGRLKDAINAYKSAIYHQPDFFEAIYNLGNAYHRLGHHQTAIVCFLKTLELKPDFAQGFHSLGLLYHHLGRVSDAIESYRKAIALNPELLSIYRYLGMAYQSIKKNNEAIECFRRVLLKDPSDISSHISIGLLLKEKKEFSDSVLCFKHALRINPDSPNGHFHLADTYAHMKKYDEALFHYQKAIQLSPENLNFYNNLGNLYKRIGQPEKAARCYVKVIQLHPDLPQAYYNLGNAFRLMGDFGKAIETFKHALNIHPDYPEAHNNIGLAYKQTGDIESALFHMRRSVSLNSNLAEAQWNLSLTLLLNGDLPEGFKIFEWRFKQYRWKAIYPFRIRGERWKGNTLPNGTIYVHDEQGLGDTIQFSRYLPLVKKRCDCLIFETRKELVSLFSNFSCIDRIMERTRDGVINIPFDATVPLMSLPMIFETNLDTIPQNVPYIQSNILKEETFKPYIKKNKLNVGIVWAGKPEHPNDANRSVRLETFSPLYHHPHLNIISLQKDHPRERHENILYVDHLLKDFSDTAALINLLDLLICVDTSVAHLAGAMGKPVWVLISTISDWRWLKSGDTTRWYPTMRLFRQNTQGNWDQVVQKIMEDIKINLAGKSIRFTEMND